MKFYKKITNTSNALSIFESQKVLRYPGVFHARSFLNKKKVHRNEKLYGVYSKNWNNMQK